MGIGMGRGERTNATTGRLVAGALFVALAAPLAGPAAAPAARAAQATPVAVEPDVPQPDECRVEPRTRFTVPREAPGLAASPVPAAPQVIATPSAGVPADAAVTEAVIATIREALACRNADDLPRAYALFTDDLVLDLLGSAETVPPEIAAALGEPGRRVPRAARLELVAVGEPTRLADGRVLARVETRSRDVVFVDDLVLRDVAGQWLIDDAFAVVGDGG